MVLLLLLLISWWCWWSDRRRKRRSRRMSKRKKQKEEENELIEPTPLYEIQKISKVYIFSVFVLSPVTQRVQSRLIMESSECLSLRNTLGHWHLITSGHPWEEIIVPGSFVQPPEVFLCGQVGWSSAFLTITILHPGRRGKGGMKCSHKGCACDLSSSLILNLLFSTSTRFFLW